MIAFQSEFMTSSQFKSFIESYQRETISDKDCADIIQKFELDDDMKNKNQLSWHGFVNYLTHSDQCIMDQNKENNVYQSMDWPIFHYFVNSSHNTYEFWFKF